MSKLDDIKDTAIRLTTGILSNPNYNFDNAKKAASIAIDHAKELVVRFAETTETGANKLAEFADKIGDKARGADDKTGVLPGKPEGTVTAPNGAPIDNPTPATAAPATSAPVGSQVQTGDAVDPLKDI